jgi:hypothetical protein
MRDSALWWVRQGVPVFPVFEPVERGGVLVCSCGEECASPAKHPRTADGFKSATLDEQQVAEWWTRWPDANIATPTGKVFDVIDVDDLAAFEAVVAEVGRPKTVGELRTGRAEGGRHYLVAPPGQKILQGGRTAPAGIDVKGEGGYIVLPPSRHVSGNLYSMVRFDLNNAAGDVSWPEFHRALSERAPKRERASTQPTPKQPDVWDQFTRPGSPEAYGAAVLRRCVEEVRRAPSGARWITLATEAVVDVTRAIVGGVLDRNEAVMALSGAAAEAGLEPSEIRRIPEEIDLLIAKGVTDPITAAPGPLAAPERRSEPSEGVPTQEAPPGRLTVSEAREMGFVFEVDPEQMPYADLMAEVANLTLRAEARLALLAQDRQPIPEWLDRSAQEGPAPMLVEHLWPEVGNVLLLGSAKAGKTTILGNLLSALCSETDRRFLGDFIVAEHPGRIVLLDAEMAPSKLAEWHNDLGVDPDKVLIKSLRGYESSFIPTDKASRDLWVAELAAVGATTLIIDPAQPLLGDLSGGDPNPIIQAWLRGVNEIAARAGIRRVMVVHHLGKDDDRGAKGAAKWEEWPDAIWQISGRGETRHFSARGRDVAIAKTQILYDDLTREVTLGERRQGEAVSEVRLAKEAELDAQVAGVLTEEWQSLRSVMGAAGIRQGRRNEEVKAALVRLYNDGIADSPETGKGYRLAPASAASEVLPGKQMEAPEPTASTLPPPCKGGEAEALAGGAAAVAAESKAEAEAPRGFCRTCGEKTSKPGFVYCDEHTPKITLDV